MLATQALVHAPSESKREQEFLTYVADRRSLLRQLVTVKLLSGHADDEHYLSMPNELLMVRRCSGHAHGKQVPGCTGQVGNCCLKGWRCSFCFRGGWCCETLPCLHKGNAAAHGICWRSRQQVKGLFLPKTRCIRKCLRLAPFAMASPYLPWRAGACGQGLECQVHRAHGCPGGRLPGPQPGPCSLDEAGGPQGRYGVHTTDAQLPTRRHPAGRALLCLCLNGLLEWTACGAASRSSRVHSAQPRAGWSGVRRASRWRRSLCAVLQRLAN
jgi:hypothetical protein